MRQGLLSEPEASSGPATMLLAVSRSPSSIPRRSPCPERCHLPLASLNHIPLSKSQKHPRLHPPPDRCHLSLASLSIHPTKPQKHPPLHPLPGAMPPSSGVPLNPPHKTAPQTDATSLWRPSPSQQKKRHPAVPTLPDTETKTPVKQTYTIYNQHSLSAQLNYHQKVLSATQDRWPAL